MGNQVQRIIDGNAQDHTGNADDDDGHVVPEHGQPAQGEQKPPAHRKEDEKDVTERVEGIGQQKEDEHHRKGYGQDAVFLDTDGVPHCNGRSADYVHGNTRIRLLHLVGDSLQEREQLGVSLGFTASEGRIQHQDRPAHIRRKDVIVIQFKTRLAQGGLQSGHHRAEEGQGIARNPSRYQRGRREHEHLPVIVQGFLQIPRHRQQAVHAFQIGLRKEVRGIFQDIIGHGGNGVHVNLGGQMLTPAPLVFGTGRFHKALDGFHRVVGVFRTGEQEDELIGPGNILIHRHLFPFPGSQRQEIADVFAKMQRRDQESQESGKNQ